MEEEKRKTRSKEFIEKIREYDEKTHFSIYLGTGLYQISMGLLVSILVSFILGLPIIMAYPFVNSILLWILKIYGWIMISFGIFTIISLLIIQKVKEDSTTKKTVRAILKINRFFMILVPFGRNLSSALKTELQTEVKKERKEKNMVGSYFSLLFVSGFIHALLGALIIFVLLDLAVDQADLLYPYINDNVLTFLEIFGWISIIPGAILMVCAFASGKLGKIEYINDQGISLKIVRNIILVSSVFILVIFPFGTFYGLTIIQEFYSLKKR
jgi:hypothetical protein